MNWDGIISLLLACIELILLVNVVIFSEKNFINIMSWGLIALLAVYQFFEFMMCALMLKTHFMPFAAFSLISFLPALNLIFILRFLGYGNKYFRLIFLPPAVFVIYYAFIINKFAVVKCTILYAAYNYPLGDLFGFFYYAPIVISMVLLFLSLRKEKEIKKAKLSAVLLAGLIFISAPVVVAFVLSSLGRSGLLDIIESIMCKFAVVYALCLAYFALTNKRIKSE